MLYEVITEPLQEVGPVEPGGDVLGDGAGQGEVIGSIPFTSTSL